MAVEVRFPLQFTKWPTTGTVWSKLGFTRIGSRHLKDSTQWMICYVLGFCQLKSSNHWKLSKGLNFLFNDDFSPPLSPKPFELERSIGLCSIPGSVFTRPFNAVESKHNKVEIFAIFSSKVFLTIGTPWFLFLVTTGAIGWFAFVTLWFMGWHAGIAWERVPIPDAVKVTHCLFEFTLWVTTVGVTPVKVLVALQDVHVGMEIPQMEREFMDVPNGKMTPGMTTVVVATGVWSIERTGRVWASNPFRKWKESNRILHIHLLIHTLRVTNPWFW